MAYHDRVSAQEVARELEAEAVGVQGGGDVRQHACKRSARLRPLLSIGPSTLVTGWAIESY
jgi:hypothetical protein